MNATTGHITHIESTAHLSVVTVQLSDTIAIKTIVVETPETASYLKLQQQVNVYFKETEVILALPNACTTSIENKIPATISSIDNGSLLSTVSLQTSIGTINALISTPAVQNLNLIPKQDVIVLVKMNEIMLSV